LKSASGFREIAFGALLVVGGKFVGFRGASEATPRNRSDSGTPANGSNSSNSK
jgi:hypothetical protein